jgi:phage terminase small subunit
VALTAKEQRFCEEYPVDWNATAAAKRAGYAHQAAYKTGSDLLKKPQVQAHIEAVKKKLRENAEINAGLILNELRDRIVADPRDLIELRRDCCRFCYGKDHRYQETPAERRARHDAHQALLKVTPQKEWPKLPAFDDMGGTGFNPKKPPLEDCPECWGDGVEKVIAKDTRYLSPAAAKLYRGVKVTNQGLEVKMSDDFKALDKAGLNLGLWKNDGGGSGDGGGLQVFDVTADEAALMRLKPDAEDYET